MAVHLGMPIKFTDERFIKILALFLRVAVHHICKILPQTEKQTPFKVLMMNTCIARIFCDM